MKKIILSFMFCMMGAIVLFAQESYTKSYYGVPAGIIKGANVTYHDGMKVTITPGYGECNGHYWEITESREIDLTAVIHWFEETLIYIYIDDSASSYPNPSIFGSREYGPSWDASRLGWYIGDDRCIGVLYSYSGLSGGIPKFTAHGNGNLVRFIMDEPIYVLVNGGTPTGSWIRITSLSDDCPTNATAVNVFAYETDSGNVDLSLTAYETATAGKVCHELSCAGYNRGSVSGWIQLGTSKDISWRGASDDDPQSTFVYLNGFEYER